MSEYKAAFIHYTVTMQMTTLSRVLSGEEQVAVLSGELSHFWSTLLYFYLLPSPSMQAGFFLTTGLCHLVFCLELQ